MPGKEKLNSPSICVICCKSASVKTILVIVRFNPLKISSRYIRVNTKCKPMKLSTYQSLTGCFFIEGIRAMPGIDEIGKPEELHLGSSL